ncbi:MAG: hypothetical protein GY789_13045 [Hyphomicrobiales bacterium]|nr:hypothetical protein [Hyphomicrobiales bacterium]MCP5002180.1 hypothetical protein [Hyphomicrobiales bacterium]
MGVVSSLGINSASELVVGQTVIVEAVHGDGSWHAGNIGLYTPIVGPVSVVGANGVSVLGSQVLVGPDTVFADGADALAGEDWIAVYGLWRGSDVVASRIVKIEPRNEAIVVGTFRIDDADGSILVGGTRVSVITPSHAKPDDVLTVRGTPGNGDIAAQSIAIGLFSGPVGDILMEGYLSQPGPQGLYTIFGSGVIAWAGDQPMDVFSGRGLYCAQSNEREPIVSLAELPEDETIRKQLLDDLGREAARKCGG